MRVYSKATLTPYSAINTPHRGPFSRKFHVHEVITNLEPHHSPPYFAYRFNSDLVTGLAVQSERLSSEWHWRGKTRYVSWETYYGVRSVALEFAIKQNLEMGFEKQAEDLKGKVENLEICEK